MIYYNNKNPVPNKMQRIVVCGLAGSGKTTLLKTIDKNKKVFILGFEEGLKRINDYLNENNNLQVAFSDNRIADLAILKTQKFIEGVSEKYDYVFVDSISSLVSSIFNHFLGISKDNWQAGSETVKLLKPVIDSILKIEKPIIFLSHLKEVTGSWQLGFETSLKEIFEREADYILYLKSNFNNKKEFHFTKKNIDGSQFLIAKCTNKELFKIPDISEANLQKLLDMSEGICSELAESDQEQEPENENGK
jgi:hypothetical protein